MSLFGVNFMGDDQGGHLCWKQIIKKETLAFDTMHSNKASGDNETGHQEEALFKPGAKGAAGQNTWRQVQKCN